MKLTLDDLLVRGSGSTTKPTIESSEMPLTIPQSDSNPPDEVIPEYMYSSPQIVGFEDEEIQERIYTFIKRLFFRIGGAFSVLEFGAGRGDFVRQLSAYGTGISYTGLEMNSLLVKVGNELYSRDEYPKLALFNLLNLDSLTDAAEIINNIPNHDFVIIPTALSINSSSINIDKWERLERYIQLALLKCTIGCKFIVIGSSDNPDVIDYDAPTVVDYISRLKLPYIIDHSEFDEIYSVTIFKPNNTIVP